ncbi:MAG: ATP-grasp domain-containing protein, partial [Chloroflexi bacterium]|nr:ATP-grasp domain-containing protein [Chloroflexota bacterium]
MKIAVLANIKEDAPISPEDPPGRWDDLDDSLTIDAILDSLQTLGYEASYFPATIRSIPDLQHFAPDLCFNSAEGHFGDSREAQIPALLDMMRIPYTCAGVLGMMLSHNKHLAKRQFMLTGLPTAKFMTIDDINNIPESDLRYPMFVKPAFEGSSIGINESAVARNYDELVRQITWSLDTLHSTVLVEEYIEGREFTIGVLGDEALPIVEIVSPTGFYSHAQKEDFESEVYRICPAKLTEAQTSEFQQLALRSMQVLKLVDVCRMDMRMDNAGNPYILEVNPIPLMYPDPKQASLIYGAFAAGYSYTDVVEKILL